LLSNYSVEFAGEIEVSKISEFLHVAEEKRERPKLMSILHSIYLFF